jgi:hypothetical protein
MLWRVAGYVNEVRKPLLQLLVLRLGFLQDGDVAVGVFPESEEIIYAALALAVSPERE